MLSYIFGSRIEPPPQTAVDPLVSKQLDLAIGYGLELDAIMTTYAKAVICIENELDLSTATIKENLKAVAISGIARQSLEQLKDAKSDVLLRLVAVNMKMSRLEKDLEETVPLSHEITICRAKEQIALHIDFAKFCQKMIFMTDFNEDEKNLFEIILLGSNPSIEGMIHKIERNITQIDWLKRAVSSIVGCQKWQRFISVISNAIQECIIADGGWELMSCVEGITYTSLSQSGMNADFCMIDSAKQINKREIRNLSEKLCLLKSEKLYAKKRGKYFDPRKLLSIVEQKSRIAFLEAFDNESSGKGINGAVFIKWKRKRGSLRSVGVFKCSNTIDSQEFISQQKPSVALGGVLGNITQAIGYYTSTSQKAIVCGAASENREACAEKAGFMIAEKFHKAIFAYRDKVIQTNPRDTRFLCGQLFTPMIAGIVDLMHSSRDKVSVGSLAVFNDNAIDADVAHGIANILEKDLDTTETIIFQLFFLFDYLIGNTDRHTGNWMVKLSYVNALGKNCIVADRAHLAELAKNTHASPSDFKIIAILPIDNGNILPTQELAGRILDSKQYDWKRLKCANIPFHPEVIEFIKSSALTSGWVHDLCESINDDEAIVKYSSDICGPFICDASIAQMVLRMRKIRDVGTGKINTPRLLAESILAKSWFG